MTVEEFSNGFDTLLDNYRRFKAYDDQLLPDNIEFSEYEKSVYLTHALNELVLQLYNNKATSDSFESTEEIRRSLDTLVLLNEPEILLGANKLTDKFNHLSYKLPNDCWYIVYELVLLPSTNICSTKKFIDVVPITHDEYSRAIKNPFRGPNASKVLRLDTGKLLVELVSSINIGNYIIRYLKKPEPIILCNLKGDGITIDGVDTPQTCKLSDLIHQDILTRAVQIALSQRSNNSNKSKS